MLGPAHVESTDLHGWRRVLRWILRISLALAALAIVAVVAALVFVNTDRGRELVRAEIEAQLRHVIVGGASIGKLEGNPLGELTLRDVVIDGPDRRPAIRVGTLRVRIGLLALIHQHVRLDELIVDELDVALERDARGRLKIADLVRPSKPDASPSSWSIDVVAFSVQRAHVMIESGASAIGMANLDDLAITGDAHLPASGARAGGLQLTALWRERHAPIALAAQVHDDGTIVFVPSLALRVGDVAVSASALELTRRDGRAPLIGGMATIAATKAAVSALVPTIELPDDVAARLVASERDGSEHLAVSAMLGTSPVAVTANVDLDREHVIADVSTGDVSVAKLTRGRLDAIAGGRVQLDVMRGRPGDLPTATVHVDAHAELAGSPRSAIALDLATHARDATVTAALSGALDAKLDAALSKTDDGFTLTRANVTASADPARASGGKAPIHGMLKVVLAASGALLPKPDLRVRGTIAGRRLSAEKLSIGSLDVAIDAAHVPSAPLGTAHAKLLDLVRGNMRLGAAAIDANSRADGKIQLAIGSQPARGPWLIELAALVTPPVRDDGALVVDVQHHRVRAGDGVDWTGTTGHFVMSREQIALSNLHSESRQGKIAIDASLVRTGAHAGDLTAKLDAKKFALGPFSNSLFGRADVKISVSRRDGRFSGDVRATGRGIAFRPHPGFVDIDATITARPERVVVAASAESPKLGSVKLDVDLAAPAQLEDVAAWKRLGRSAVRKASIELHDVDLARATAKVPKEVRPTGDAAFTGRIDGKLEITPTAATGAIHVRGLQSPQLQRAVDAELVLEQAAIDELSPTLTVAVAGVGKATARARLAIPEHVLDPAAWRQLGTRAVRSATLRTDTIAFDPTLFAWFGISTAMRGRARVQLDVGDAFHAVHLEARADQLRGTPVATPIALRVDASIDQKATTASLVVTSQRGDVTMLEVDGQIPLSLDQLRAHAIRTLPVSATLTLPSTSAPQLLGIFGRTQLIAGTLDGKVEISGTVGNPVIAAHLVGTGLAVPPGLRGASIKTIQKVVVDASWHDRRGALAITGTEDRGGTLHVVANATLGQLAAATAKVDAHAFDLGPLLAFAPGPAGGSEGTLDATLAITGFDPRTAKVLGELHLHDARLPIAPTIGTLRDSQIDVAIHPHDISIGATGKLGGGDVKVAGSIALDGVALSGGQATITLHKVTPIGAVEPQIDAAITAKLARKGTTWTADVVIDHGFVKLTKTSGKQLKPVGAPADLVIGKGPAARRDKAPGAQSPPTKPALVATVTLHPLEVESDEFRTTVSGKLAVKADASAVGVVGTIAAQSGDLDLFGRRYRVERAAVTFDGSIDPQLDIRITYDFPDVTTNTDVRGRLSKPELELSSNPPLYTKSQLLGFLLGGEPNGNPNSASARDAATQAGESLVGSQIGGYVKKALPFDIDVIKYEAATIDSSAAITVGTWITHTLFLAFREHLDARPDENSSEGDLEYWINRQLDVETTAGDRGFDALNILWRRRF